jgi:hypothetical protein
LIKEVGIENLLGNPTYTPTTRTKEEILDNHRSVICSFGISTKDEELDLPSLTHNNTIVRGLVGGDNSIFVMKERQVFSNIWVFKD